MKKIIQFVCLAIIFLTTIFSSVGCSVKYVKGNLDYINRSSPKKDVKTPDQKTPVAYRVNVANVNFIGTPKNIKKTVDKEFGNFLKKNIIISEKTLGDDQSRFFFNVSLTSSESQTRGELMSSVFSGLVLGLYPGVSDYINIYYAIDVYDKMEVDLLLQKVNERLESGEDSKIYDSLGNVLTSKLAYKDLDISALKPLARYEYRHEITERVFAILAWPIGLPFMPFLTKNRAFNKILIDMNNQFAADIEIGFNSAITHNIHRDGYGIFLSQDQAKYLIYPFYADTAGDILKSMETGISTFGNNITINREDVSKDGVAEARVIGKNLDIKSTNILREKLTDNSKNYYMLFYKKNKNGKGYAFGSMSNSIEKLNLDAYKGKEIKIKRAYYNSENELKAWIKNYQKSYNSTDN